MYMTRAGIEVLSVIAFATFSSALCGVTYAFMSSSQRLMGFQKNDAEVARYGTNGLENARDY